MAENRQPRALVRVGSYFDFGDPACRYDPKVHGARDDEPKRRKDILNKPCPMCGCPTWGKH
jgi:hypothetical protein